MSFEDKALKYNLRPHNSIWYMRLFERFRPGFWATLNDTVYHPSDIDPSDPQWQSIIEHEEVHIEQIQKYGFLLHTTLYFLLPFPIFFAYFRWKFEREAYLVTLSSFPTYQREEAVEKIVDSLWSEYFLTWPKSLMRKWFLEQLVELEK